jgi:hypothetical protein
MHVCGKVIRVFVIIDFKMYGAPNADEGSGVEAEAFGGQSKRGGEERSVVRTCGAWGL